MSDIKKKQVQVGLLVDEISNTYSQLICQGAYEACQKIGAKLTIFFGGFYMNTFKEYDYQKNMLYPIANSTDLDFLIVSIASICRSSANKQKILAYFNQIPIITLNESFEGTSSILVDNENGLQEALEYIIQKTNGSSFAMVAGPSINRGSNTRKKVFESVLRKHGLEKEIYVEHAPIMERTSTETIRTIFEKKPQTNVLICANDELAIAAYQVCGQTNRIVGKDVLILGFDDIHEASCLQPALSSIKSPIEDIGYQAVIQGDNQLKTQEIFTSVLPTYFIQRKSLGKSSETSLPFLQQMMYLIENRISFDEFWASVVDYLHKESEPLHRLLYTVYTGNLTKSSSFDSIKSQIEEFFTSYNSFYRIDIMTFLHVFERALYFYILNTEFKNEAERKNAFREYETISLLIVSQFNTKLMQAELARYADSLQINSLARKVMMFANTKECYENILQAISELDIQYAKVYLFEQAIEQESYLDIKDSLFLMGQIQEGERTCFTQKKYYSIQHLVSDAVSEQNDKPMCVLSIYANTKLYGYILSDVSLENCAKLEFLNIHIATSLDTLRLMTNLKYQSRIDSLTGLYNRRGLEENLEEYIKDQVAKEFYVIIADIDNLKQMNDCYGHKAGDISIQKGAKILQMAYGKKAFLVRMGGDEFIALLPKEKEDIGAEIEKAEKKVNQNIVQALPTIFSYGIQIVKKEDLEDVQSVIQEGDRLMYIHKQTKKKGN